MCPYISNNVFGSFFTEKVNWTGISLKGDIRTCLHTARVNGKDLCHIV